jgi:superfamily II DNA helicase RecQ
VLCCDKLNLHLLFVITLRGYNTLREHQYDICEAVLAGKDVFVLMATGSGKSLSYQLPPVLLQDNNVQAWSLVICPLISLAEDQVAELNAIGIPVRDVS